MEPNLTRNEARIEDGHGYALDSDDELNWIGGLRNKIMQAILITSHESGADLTDAQVQDGIDIIQDTLDNLFAKRRRELVVRIGDEDYPGHKSVAEMREWVRGLV